MSCRILNDINKGIKVQVTAKKITCNIGSHIFLFPQRTNEEYILFIDVLRTLYFKLLDVANIVKEYAKYRKDNLQRVCVCVLMCVLKSLFM